MMSSRNRGAMKPEGGFVRMVEHGGLCSPRKSTRSVVDEDQGIWVIRGTDAEEASAAWGRALHRN